MWPALDIAWLHVKQFYTSFMNMLNSAISFIYIYIKERMKNGLVLEKVYMLSDNI
jgi:hypothetical protein